MKAISVTKLQDSSRLAIPAAFVLSLQEEVQSVLAASSCTDSAVSDLKTASTVLYEDESHLTSKILPILRISLPSISDAISKRRQGYVVTESSMHTVSP